MPRFGLRTKFFLYSNTLIVVTMSLVTVLALIHEHRVRYEAIQRRAESIVESLAIPITDALMYEDLGLVSEEGLTDNYIAEILRRNQDLMRYVIVTDATGRVTHSNRWELLGQIFPRALDPADLPWNTEKQVLEGEGDERLLEVRSPLNISTKFWGSVAIGFSLRPIDAEVRAIAVRAIIVAVLLMIGNSLMTAIYVETLIRPILGLYRIMRRAGEGDLGARAKARRGDEVGELARAFNGMMDELERARQREKIAQMQLGHTEKMAAVGTLAAGVAHEVNNPLAGILTCIENLRADPCNQELQEKYLTLIHDGLKRIESTVANLLDFSRQRTLNPEAVSINHSVRHVVELAAYQLRQRGVEVTLELDDGEPMVMADHFQMEQLFLNLVLNAAQAMPEGGSLTLRSFQRGGDACVEVRDTGVGIEEDLLKRIFDPFFSTRGVGEGTGLGLTVSDAIVSSHGGAIEVESEVGMGSVFRVVLPCIGAGPAAKEA